MAADALRKRVRAEIARRHLNPNAVSERADLSPNLLHKFLKDPERGADPATCRKLAAYFDWPVVDVFRWADLLPPAAADPLADLHSAIYQGTWDEEDARALYRLAQRTVQAARPQVEPAELKAKVEHAADKALRPYAAKRDRLFSSDEVRKLMTGHFLHLLQEEFSGVGGAS